MNMQHPFHADALSVTDAELTGIAQEILHVTTLRPRGRNDYDYPIVSVTRLHDALRAAYALGARDRRAGV